MIDMVKINVITAVNNIVLIHTENSCEESFDNLYSTNKYTANKLKIPTIKIFKYTLLLNLITITPSLV